jgi:hypothetical protein
MLVVRIGHPFGLEGLRANAYTKRARRGCRTWPRPWLGRLIFIVVSVRGYLGGSWWR